MITQEYLKRLFIYNAETGLFTWKIKKAAFITIGDPVGTKKKGSLFVIIDGNGYYLHRLAWLYVTGENPNNILFHKDNDKTNNRFDNLTIKKHSDVELTIDRLKYLLTYEKESGLFIWNINKKNAHKGDVAGSIDAYGYLRVKIDGKTIKLHRLAFFYMTGKWPSCQVDHIDRNKKNNSWNNLRECTIKQNSTNKSSRNKHGLKGVSKNFNKWQAQIRIGSKKKHLGSFETPEEAHQAYCKAAKQLHGDFYCP